MVDQNEVQGRELIRLGKCSQEVIHIAYQAVKPYPHLDICEYLVTQGQISLTDAQFVRRSVSSISPSPNPPFRASPATVADEPSSASRISRLPSSSFGVGASRSIGLNEIRRLGDYEILEEIAQGGMGAVYLVQSVSLKTKFALKTLLAGQLAGSEALERFMLEAETTARLNHPNIVRIHHIGEDQGFHYLVMDYIEGPTLKDMVVDGDALTEKDCAALIAKLAKALSYAHSHAILHRDVKPANVLVRQSDGEPLLTDFGLAKDISDGREGLTISGQAIGTPEFMSPEQADGDLELVDRRSDVYSLGATLYQLLTKKPPFQGSTVTNTLKAVMLNEPETPKKSRPDLSTDLETICLKCLEKDPAQRYSTALGLAEDLQRFLADEAILARPPSLSERFRRWRKRHSTKIQIAITVLLTSCLLLGLLGFRQYREAQKATRIQSRLDKALEQSFAALREAPRALFETWDERLSVLDADIQTQQGKSILGSYESELAELAKELKEVSLKAQAVEVFETEWKEATQGYEKERGDVPNLKNSDIQSFMLSPLWAEIEAHRQCTLAHIFEKRGEKKKAEFARTRAYQVSPQSAYGNEALLDAAELILEEERFVIADELFARIVKQPSIYLKGRAYYGRARIALWRQQTSKTLSYVKEIERLRKVDKRLSLEMSDEKLLWLKQIASRFGRVQGSTRASGMTLIANLPGQAPLFREETGPSRLQFYFGHWRNHKLELKPGPVFDLPGVFVRQAQWQQGSRSIWGIQYSDSRGNRIAFWEWDGKTAKRLNWPVVLLRPLYRLRRMGDFDGTGELDLIVDCPFGAKSKDRTFVRVRLNVHTPQRRELLLKEVVGSVLYCIDLADLDGDGVQEIVLGLGEWNHFCVLVFKLANNAAGYSPPFRRTLGIVVSADVRRSELLNRDEVILSVYRRREFDIKRIFQENLSPEKPNGVWRLRYKDEVGDYELELVASTPFEQRDKTRLSAAMFLGSFAPKFPGSHVFLELGEEKDATFHFVPGPDFQNLPTLLAKAPRGANVHYRFSIHDVDGDGDGELFFGTYKHKHNIYGLKDEELKDTEEAILSQENVNKVKIEEDVIEVVLNLLDLRKPAAARLVIERYRRSNELTVMQWVNTQKYLAMSWAQEENFELAKQHCLKAWSVAPRQSFDLVMEAVEYACRLDDYSEALRIIENIPNFIQMNTEQDSRFRKTKQRVAAVAGMTKVIRIDKARLESGELPFSIRKPWFFKWTKDGFSIRVQKRAGPLLTLPINNRGGPIRFRSLMRVPFLQFGERINFGLEVKNSVNSLLHVRIDKRGGGDLYTLQRTIRFFSQLGDSPYGTRGRLKAFSGDQDILFDGLYNSEDRSLICRLDLGGEVSRIEKATKWRFNSGIGRFFIGYNGDKKTTVGARPGHSLIEIRSLNVEANAKLFTVLPRDPQDVLGQAGYLFFLGRYKKTDALLRKKIDLGGWQRGSEQWVEAHFLLGLTQSRLNQSDKARKTFRAVENVSSRTFRTFWESALCVLSNEEIGNLARAVFKEKSPVAIDHLLQSGALGKDQALSLLAATQSPEMETLRMAERFLNVGAYKRSIEQAEKFLAKSRGSAHFIAGISAYKSGRYRECLEFWEPLRKNQAFLNSRTPGGPSVKNAIKHAEFVLKHVETSKRLKAN
ncbi:MAG: serine/threonine-protein kinase [Planctomycetota bacterium]|nr:serine/threonine-protein kinase [Planctomycetota bacterium]